MRFRLLILNLAAATIALIAHRAFAQPAAVSLSQTPAASNPAFFSPVQNHEPVISLDGLWRFHAGDDPQWASPAFDDSAWPLLRSDQSWTAQGYKDQNGFAWYRFRAQAPSGATSLALLLTAILTDYEVFANGVKIGGFGEMPPRGSLRFNQPLLFHLTPVPAGATIQFAIRVWHHPIFATYLGGGPRYEGARLGDAVLLERRLHLLQAERLTGVVSFYAVGILNAVISITLFGLFFFRRSEREYLWFAVVLLANALQSALAITDFILRFPLGVHDFLAETIGAVGITASLLFFSRVLEARKSLMWKTVLIIAVLDPLNVLLFVFRLTSPATSTSLRILFELPIEIYIVVLLCRHALAGNRNARILFAPTILSYGTAILGGMLLLCFQLGWGIKAVIAINRWSVTETPFPVSLQVFVQLIFVVALLAFLIRRFAMSRAQEERLTADLEAARTIQQVLIPESAPSISNLEIECVYHPAQEVGGDFYQIIPLPRSSPDVQPDSIVILGDVAGKGLPAAMTVSLLIGALRSIVETTSSPSEILSSLNRRLLGRGFGFTTCLALRISASGNLSVANAGHLPPYLNGQEVSLSPAFPLGLDANADYAEQTFHLVRKDRLTLLTDGVPEAGSGRELFGFERTASLSSSPAPTIADAALRFGQSDDITVISIVVS
jgi:phosphoserine phosphatase RsbU/P